MRLGGGGEEGCRVPYLVRRIPGITRCAKTFEFDWYRVVRSGDAHYLERRSVSQSAARHHPPKQRKCLAVPRVCCTIYTLQPRPPTFVYFALVVFSTRMHKCLRTPSPRMYTTFDPRVVTIPSPPRPGLDYCDIYIYIIYIHTFMYEGRHRQRRGATAAHEEGEGNHRAPISKRRWT